MDNNKRNNIPQISIFDRFSNWFFSMLKSGFFGYFFTSYDNINDKFTRKKVKEHNEEKPSTRRRFASAVEKSRVINFVPKISDFLLRLSVRDYGIVFITMGISIIILYLIQQYVQFLYIGFESFVGAIAIAVLALPFLISSKSISQIIIGNKVFSGILFGFFGIRYEKFRIQAENKRLVLSTLSLLFGIILAVGAYFISPVNIVLILLGLAFAYATLITPEVGIVLTLLILPFISTYVIAAFMFYILGCYLIKYILKKRIFKFEYFDLWILILFVCVFICSLFTKNFFGTLPAILTNLVFILSYFAIANLIRSKEWYARCIKAIVFSSVFASLVAIVQFIFSKIGHYVTWFERFLKYEESFFSTFDSPTLFAQYLVCVIPFIVVYMISIRQEFKAFFGFIVTILSVACLVMTYNGYAIIAAIVAVLMLLIIFHRNFIYLAITTIVSFALLYFLLPKHIVEKFLATMNIMGGNTPQRIPYFQSMFEMIKARPFGYAFSDIPFAEFASEGGISNANSLYLQIAITCGILGLIVFVAFCVIVAKLNFSYLIKAPNKFRKINCLAGFCSFIGILTVGLFDYAWLDKRIMLMFFISIGLSMAYIRLERDEQKPHHMAIDISYAHADIPLATDSIQESVPVRKYVRIPKPKKFKLSKTNMAKNKFDDSTFDTREYDTTSEFSRIDDKEETSKESVSEKDDSLKKDGADSEIASVSEGASDDGVSESADTLKSEDITEEKNDETE